MIDRILILTASAKHGGNCVAGVSLSTKKWVRLCSNLTISGTLMDESMIYEKGGYVSPLDIIEVELYDNCPQGSQVENWTFNEEIKLKKIKTITPKEISNYMDVKDIDFIFSNNNPKLNENEYMLLDHSLCIAKIDEISIYPIKFTSGESKWKKTRCSFNYNGKHYFDIRVTDRNFFSLEEEKIIKDVYVAFSLPKEPFGCDGFYYKFAASIIPID